MNTTIDAGHKYKLFTLDGELEQTLTFVKRCDLDHPWRFPGNTNSYPGTTLQSVIRVLIDRIKYLDNQIPDYRNGMAIGNLKTVLWLLESRAAERHGYRFGLSPEQTYSMPMCSHCGHVLCKEITAQEPLSDTTRRT
jgi:hypothetical protein